MRWIGIDEAGYGPNLGPLVMTAVVAEDDATPGNSRPTPPDLWRDLSPKVVRSGGPPNSLWVDDSKRILRGGIGRDRLEATCLSLATSISGIAPSGFESLLTILQAGSPGEAEYERWAITGSAPWPSLQALSSLERHLSCRPFQPERATWRLVGVRSVVMGPERFNRRLANSSTKAEVHYSAFRELLQMAWSLASDGQDTSLRGDKHGGRHYYMASLLEDFPECWIDRGPEGPNLSRYVIRSSEARMTLSFTPKADAEDGLVALASIVSKTVRELWMDVFNAYWLRQIDGLNPTAGYPVDAARFRRAIESRAASLGFELDQWWRAR